MQSNDLHVANVRATVSMLPIELFLSIVSVLRDVWQPEGADSRTFSERLAWLNVTFVCRQWRSATLEMASLWARVDLCVGAEWVATFFERARSTPMQISVAKEFSGLFGLVERLHTILIGEPIRRYA